MFFGSFQSISRLDSQRKFQMFPLFSIRYVGGAESSTNMAASYSLLVYSGAPAARGEAKRSPILIWKENETHQ